MKLINRITMRLMLANGRIYGTEDVGLNDRCSIDIRKAFTHSDC